VLNREPEPQPPEVSVRAPTTMPLVDLSQSPEVPEAPSMLEGLDLSIPQETRRTPPSKERRPAVGKSAKPSAPSPVPAAAPSPAGVLPDALSSLQAESQLLSQAIALRLHGDHAGALRSLDEHRRRFPAGQLIDEVRAERIKSLLTLHRRGDALNELAGLSEADFVRIARGAELQVLLAELQYGAGKVDESMRHFDALNSRAVPDGVKERAIYGRALARARSGDSPGSRADLRRYLELFPSGRFAPQARELLDRPSIEE
jgi:TolA-binding protein